MEALLVIEPPNTVPPNENTAGTAVILDFLFDPLTRSLSIPTMYYPISCCTTFSFNTFVRDCNCNRTWVASPLHNREYILGEDRLYPGIFEEGGIIWAVTPELKSNNTASTLTLQPMPG